MTTILLRLACALLSLTASLSAQLVLHVNPNGGPGVDHTSITAAIASAPDGTTILVDSGVYTGFSIVSRSLDVIALPGAAVGVSSPVSVSDTAVDQPVTLRGLQLQTFQSTPLRIEDCAGTVWVEGCLVSGFPAVRGNSPKSPGAQILASSAVVMVDCQLKGRDTKFGGTEAGGAGLVVNATSAVTLQRTEIEGGRGSCSFGSGCVDGGPALLLAGGDVRGLDCTLRGGASGPGVCCAGAGDCVETAHGGLALSVTASGASLWGTDIALQPGSGAGLCGLPGAPIQGLAALALQDGEPVSLSTPSVVAVGARADLVVDGQPDGLVTLVLAPAAAPFWSQSFFGTFVGTAPVVLDVLGPTDALGQLTLTVTGPWLPTGIDALPAVLQAVQVQGGATVLGSASKVTVIRP